MDSMPDIDFEIIERPTIKVVDGRFIVDGGRWVGGNPDSMRLYVIEQARQAIENMRQQLAYRFVGLPREEGPSSLSVSTEARLRQARSQQDLSRL